MGMTTVVERDREADAFLERELARQDVELVPRLGVIGRRRGNDTQVVRLDE